MYVLKHIPEDFQVQEVSTIQPQEQGEFSLFILKKRKKSTLQAIHELAKVTGKSYKQFGFAGNKDKNAVTTQWISVKGSPASLSTYSDDNISLSFQGKTDRALALGQLEANKFTLTIRNLDKDEVQRLMQYQSQPLPNYFGRQRFGKSNIEIGRAILKQQFKHAVELITKNEGEFEGKIRFYMKRNPTNYIGGLRSLPKKLLTLYISAFQSHIFNKLLEQFAKDQEKHGQKLPMVGFGIDQQQAFWSEPLEKLLQEEQITLRSFILQQIPEISCEGSYRMMFFQPQDWELQEVTDDDMFKGKKKATVSFALARSCYATTLISGILQNTKHL